jgi:hypothetical protein
VTKRIVFGLFGLIALVGGLASAQTYVRPSKGTVLSWYTAPQGAAAATVTSFYDWTAFYSASIVLSFAKQDGTSCACPSVFNPSTGQTRAQCSFAFPKFNIKATADKTASTLIDQLNYDGATFFVFGNAATDAYAVPSLNLQLPFIKGEFRTGTYTDYAGNAIATPCYAKIVATPLPFPFQMIVEGAPVSFDPNTGQGTPNPIIAGGIAWDYGYPANLPLNVDQSSGALFVRQHTRPKLNPGSEAVVTVPQYAKVCASNVDCGNTGGYISSCVAGACTVAMVLYASGYPAAGGRFQNVGVYPALCAAGEDASQLSSTRYSFILKADTSAGAGAGGTIEIPFAHSEDQNKTKVFCTGSGGDTTIAVMPY